MPPSFVARGLLALSLGVIACGRDERAEQPLPRDLDPPQQVRIDGTVVEIGRSLAWIEDANGRRMPVVPRDEAMLVGIRPGQRVDLDGELRLTPQATDALDRLRVLPDERARLLASPRYIYAIRIATAGAAHPRS